MKAYKKGTKAYKGDVFLPKGLGLLGVNPMRFANPMLLKMLSGVVQACRSEAGLPPKSCQLKEEQFRSLDKPKGGK